MEKIIEYIEILTIGILGAIVFSYIILSLFFDEINISVIKEKINLNSFSNEINKTLIGVFMIILIYFHGALFNILAYRYTMPLYYYAIYQVIKAKDCADINRITNIDSIQNTDCFLNNNWDIELYWLSIPFYNRTTTRDFNKYDGAYMQHLQYRAEWRDNNLNSEQSSLNHLLKFNRILRATIYFSIILISSSFVIWLISLFKKNKKSKFHFMILVVSVWIFVNSVQAYSTIAKEFVFTSVKGSMHSEEKRKLEIKKLEKEIKKLD